MRKCIFILLVILAVSYRLEAKKAGGSYAFR